MNVKMKSSGKIFKVLHLLADTVVLQSISDESVKEISIKTFNRTYIKNYTGVEKMTKETGLVKKDIEVAKGTKEVKENVKKEVVAKKAVEKVVIIDFTKLQGAKEKAEFEALISPVAVVKGHDAIEQGDYAFAKKAIANGKLCFVENMQRFQISNEQLAEAEENLKKDSQNEALKHSVEKLKNSLQNYANKMAFHYGRAVVAQKIEEKLRPVVVEKPAVEKPVVEK